MGRMGSAACVASNTQTLMTFLSPCFMQIALLRSGVLILAQHTASSTSKDSEQKDSPD